MIFKTCRIVWHQKAFLRKLSGAGLFCFQYMDQSCPSARILELAVVKRRVKTVLCQQLRVAAPLYDIAVPYHKDEIGILNRGQTMSNYKACFSLHQPGHGLLDLYLGSRINAGGGFIQHQNGGIRQHGSGNG